MMENYLVIRSSIVLQMKKGSLSKADPEKIIKRGKIVTGVPTEQHVRKGNSNIYVQVLQTGKNTFIEMKNVKSINETHSNFGGTMMPNMKVVYGAVIGTVAGLAVAHLAGGNKLIIAPIGLALGVGVGLGISSGTPKVVNEQSTTEEKKMGIEGCDDAHQIGAGCTTHSGLSGKWKCVDLGAGPTWGCDTGAQIVRPKTGSILSRFKKKRSNAMAFSGDKFENLTHDMMSERF